MIRPRAQIDSGTYVASGGDGSGGFNIGRVNLYSATWHRLDVLGGVHLTVTIAGQTSRQPFIVVRKLGTDAILGTDFIDSQVESIQVRKRVSVVRDDVMVPIVRRLAPVPTEDQTSEPKEVGPRKRAPQDFIRVTQGISLPARAETVVPVSNPVHGLRLLEPHEPLYERRRVSVAHRIVEVRPHTPFNVEVAKVGEEKVVLVPNQIVGRALEAPIPSQILAVNLDPDPEVSALPEERGP